MDGASLPHETIRLQAVSLPKSHAVVLSGISRLAASVDAPAMQFFLGWLAYNELLAALSPYFVVGKLVAWMRHGKPWHFEPARWTLRQTECAPKQPGQRRIAYVCASFGEATMARALHRQLEAREPGIDAVYCIRNALERARFHAVSGCRSVPLPFDFVLPFLRWFNRVQPDLVVFVEKPFFGNLVLGSKARGARLVAINARANDRRSFIRRLLSPHYPLVVRAFDWIGARSEEHAQRIRSISPTACHVENIGNYKVGMPISPIPGDKLDSLHRWVETASRPDRLFVAGSLESGEEIGFVLQAFHDLEKNVGASLMVAPRHLEDCEQVVSLARQLGYRCSLRSQPESGAEVLVLDTLGELANAYRFGIGAFVGGTIAGVGHNPIEPLHWGIPVAYGPVRGYFEDLQTLCERHGIGYRVRSPQELARHWEMLALDAPLREALKTAIRQGLQEGSQAFWQTVERVADVLSRCTGSRA